MLKIISGRFDIVFGLYSDEMWLNESSKVSFLFSFLLSLFLSDFESLSFEPKNDNFVPLREDDLESVDDEFDGVFGDIPKENVGFRPFSEF